MKQVQYENIKSHIILILFTLLCMILTVLFKHMIKEGKDEVHELMQLVQDEKEIVEILTLQVEYLKSPKRLITVKERDFALLRYNTANIITWKDFTSSINIKP